MLNGRNILLTCALFSFAAPAAQSGSLVYVVTGGITGNGAFGTMDLSTGQFNQLGPNEPDGYDGLAPGPNGSLYTLTYAGNIVSINPGTGTPTQVGPSGLSPCVIPSSACSPNSGFLLGGSGGKLYATDFANNLYVVNPVTGLATLIGATGIPAFPYVPGTQNPDGTSNLGDEALFSAGGKLYAISDAFVFDFSTGSVVNVVTAPKLYLIDPFTGHATSIASVELGLGAAVEAAGTVYAFNEGESAIETLNLTTGASSAVANFDPADGLILGASTVATPEPASSVLLLFGLGLVVTAKTMKRASVKAG